MLSSGVHRYRFIVDGERRFIPDLPCETDNMGQVVNLVDVHVSIIYILPFIPTIYWMDHLKSLFELELYRTQHAACLVFIKKYRSKRDLTTRNQGIYM